MYEEYLSEGGGGRGELSPESGEVARLTSRMARKVESHHEEEEEEEEDVNAEEAAALVRTRARGLAAAAERAMMRAEHEESLERIRAEAQLSVKAVREAGEHAKAALLNLTSHTAGEVMVAIGQCQKQAMEQLAQQQQQQQQQMRRAEQYHHTYQAPKAWLQDRAEFPPLLAQDLPIQAKPVFKGQADYVTDYSSPLYQQQQLQPPPQQQQQQLQQPQLGYHTLHYSGFQQQQPLLQQHSQVTMSVAAPHQSAPPPPPHMFYHQECQQVQHQMDLLSHIPSRG